MPQTPAGNGKEVFFRWINMDGYGAAIDEALQLSVDIHARPATSALTVDNGTAIGAKKTSDNGFFRGITIAFYRERPPVAGLWR